MRLMAETALRIRNLRVNFYTYDGVVQAIDDVDLELRKGETLGLVGETGCGKSVTVQSIIRLIPEPPGRVEDGEAFMEMPESEWERMLGLEEKLRARHPQAAGPDNGSRPLNLARLQALQKSLRRKRVPVDAVVRELIDLKGKYDVLWKEPEELRHIRGNQIAMIFQEPAAALNPVLSVERQIGESFLIHRHEEVCDATLRSLEKAGLKAEAESKRFRASVCRVHMRFVRLFRRKPKSRLLSLVAKIPGLRRWRKWLDKEIKARVVEVLEGVRIPNPEKVVDQYPHELSGGMQQRVLIAMALSANPEILIADEPTTALDVTIQAQILRLIQTLKEEFQSSIIFITHDLAVIAQISDRVAVMYAGTICETGDVKDIFKNPLHPYTQGLVRAVPRPDRDLAKLEEISGIVPNLISPPTGCRFHPRCPLAKDYCKEVKPTLLEVVGERERSVACHIHGPKGDLWEG